jgi:FlaG/FlaF family flagellin (archaellin)
MVAVTVILAAVVSTLVLGMDNDIQTTPQTSFGFDYDGTDLTITHTGGKALETSDLSVSSGTVAWNHGGDSKISAGETGDVTGLSAGDTVNVVWTGQEDNSAILASYQVPA